MNAPQTSPAWNRAVSNVLILGSLLLAGCAGSPARHPALERPSAYPLTAKVDQVDDYHGTKVADPYRWLEDTDSPPTKAWVEAQNKLTFAYLEQIPARNQIKQRLTQLWNYERYGVPVKIGGRYFFTRNDGLQNQSVLYTAQSLEAEPAVLLDPNLLSTDGTVALSGSEASDDGKRLAYGLSTAGSDWQEWKVLDVASGQDLPDHLKWVKFSGASWSKDGQGFYYSRYDEPKETARLRGLNYFHKLYYHRLGTAQSADALVYHRPDQKEWEFSGNVTEDGRYLIITVHRGTDTKNAVFYRDLQTPGAPVVELLREFDADYRFISNDGPLFWFRTDWEAPRGRVLAINITKPARDHWKEVIPQSSDTLIRVSAVNDQFIANYLTDAHSQIKTFNLKGGLIREVDLPGLGTASGFGGLRKDQETFYALGSFTTPTTIFRYDAVQGRSAVFRQSKVDFHPGDYETKQVFYRSQDGTRIPMFITHRKGLKQNGRNPTFLFGYGGFNISMTPNFSVANLVWMEMGGVYALANLRGGGEYGEEWHRAGMKLNKQNVFDDFIAAAEWLIANNYTRSANLAIGGGSNGGLLVGAGLTQRPDLFGAALPAVGVMDMLRFHKFTIGWAWTSDYGSAENPDEFKALYAYSPLHHLRPGTVYPPTLVTTADHDDRVVPGHSFKFAAALQAAQAGPGPALIRIETKAGHGAGKPTAKVIEEAADKWAFLVRELKMKTPQFGRR
ncbi:MAG: S9 family peptidase [Chloroflexi bacterium]|nr:S9 family peptidase [Chloroflexota bacterium]